MPGDPPVQPALRAEQLRRIDELCDQFESALATDQPLALEGLLDQLEEAARPRLLKDLLEVEIRYRRGAGNPIAPEEAKRRFAALGPWAAGVLREVGLDPFGLPATGPEVRPLQPAAGGVFAGRYKLREKLGEGGMGAVWVADQTEPVQRRVALKLIKSELPSERLLGRFDQERQALALMDHHNIAKVLDGGVVGGMPYFVMELVKGVPLTKYCDGAKLSIRQRLELFIPVCCAVQHAHQKGVIHRDLKPSNVLVGLYDGKPVPKVIDFGLAKAMGTSLGDHSVYTEVGTLMGTPEYMAPEQADLDNLDVDTRADIYSLGVILYELLTGSVPFPAKELRAAGYKGMARILKEKEPPSPSTRLSAADTLAGVAAARRVELGKLTRLVRGELDWIVMKALEKERSRRYETANGFARDVERFLNLEPVLAGPPSAAYRLRKFVRRNRAQVIAGGLVLLALLLGFVGTAIGFIRAEQAWAKEAEQRAKAEEEKGKAEEAAAATLASYRASTDDAIEHLIGAKADLGPQERAYIQMTLARWQEFAKRQGEDEGSQAIRAEGHHRVADLWYKLGRRDEARGEYETARDLWKKLADASPAAPGYRAELAGTHHNLGLLLADQGKGDEARKEYEKALNIQMKLADDFPAAPQSRRDLARTHNSLGGLLADLGQPAEARKEYEAARDLRKKLADASPEVPQYRQDLARTHNRLGKLLYGLGRRDEARREYEKALTLQKKLADVFPTVPKYKESLAGTHNDLGVLLRDQGKIDEARKEYEKARDLKRKLADEFPSMPWYRGHLATTHHNLGNLLSVSGKRDEARKEYEKARDLDRKLADEFPAVQEYQKNLAGTHNSLGVLLYEEGKIDEACREFETALGLQKKLADDSPDVPGYKVDFGGSCCNFGNLLCKGGKPADSLQWFDLAIRTLTPVYEKETRASVARRFLRNSHWSRARTFDQLKKHAEAARDWDRAVELSPQAEQPFIRAGRATSRVQAGQVAEAVAEVAELTKSPMWNAEQWYDFACAYAVASGKLADKKPEHADRAMQLLHQAVKAGYKNAAHMAKDSDLDPLRGRVDFQKLLADLNAAKGKKP